jgi:hypothetical protein
MGLSHILAIVDAMRDALEPLGYAVACTAPRNRAFSRIVRVYASERDKGHPERALHETDTFNRYTLPECFEALGIAGYETTTP